MKHLNILKQVLLTTTLLLLGYQQSSAQLSGTYTVGTGGTYATLQDAVSDLNTYGVSGPVVFAIKNGSYSGAGWQVTIGAFSGMSSSNNVVIMPESGVKGTASISYAGTSTDNYVISLAGCNYVYIRNLTISNTGTSYGTVISVSSSSSNDSVVGCTLNTPSTTSTSSDMSVVSVGVSASHTGSNVSFRADTLNNGSVGLYANASTNLVFDNNYVVNPRYRGVYASYTDNFKMRNNNIVSNSTGMNTGLYFDYTVNGLDVSGNTVSLTTGTASAYGLYNNYVNSANFSAAAVFNNNTISVISTSGSPRALYNNYSRNLVLTNNTITAQATSNGVVYPPTMAYNGQDIYAKGNTFNTYSTTGGIATSTYYFIYNSSNIAMNVTVRENTFNNTVTSGQIGNTSYQFMYYPNNCQVNKNTFNVTRSSYGTIYGFMGGYYFNYYGTSSTFDSNSVTLNAPSGTSTCYFMGYYNNFYGSNNSFSADTFTYNVPGSSTLYGLGIYNAYFCTNLKYVGNVLNVNTTYATVYTPYYFAYYNTGSTFDNNTVNINNTTGTVYSPFLFNYYNTSTTTNYNTFNINKSSGTCYLPYYCMYYGTGSVARGNTFNGTANSFCYFYSPYYTNAYGSNDTVENNTWNLSTQGGSIYTYNYYLNNVTRNNTWNMTNTSGSNNFMFYYPSGGVFTGNTINSTTTTGTIYNCYDYCPSSYSGTLIQGNKFKLQSTTGTIYAYYGQRPNGNKYINNIFSTSTAGSSYLLYNPIGNYGSIYFYNNTFHSNSTGSTNMLVYNTGGSTSNSGKIYLNNNIFSASNTTSATPVYIADTVYFKSDYNLMYAPNSVNMQCVTPSVNATSLQAWRNGTKQDRNSLFYDPGYVDAANNDFRPSATNPNAWSVNGRGVHIAGDTLDYLNTPRAKVRQQGVPDLGAYEFTPTSIPPDAVASPASPVANSVQVFTFGGDTVGQIRWGATVPATAVVKQYTGTQAGPMPAGTGRMYFYADVQTPAVSGLTYAPMMYYKDPWLGDISSETNAKIAKSSNGGTWQGYNYSNGITDTILNVLASAADLDSMPSKFTGVENARIGIRCVIAPTGMAHSNITANAADETWDPVFNPIGYQYAVDYSATNAPSSGTPINFSATNTVNLTGLTEDKMTYVHVRSICGLKDTSGWSVDSFMTLITCHAPTLGVNSITDRQALIYWDTVKTAIGYDYEISTSSTPPIYGTPTASRSVLASYLKSGTTYYAHVRTNCNSMYAQSPWSTISFTTRFATSVSGVNGTAVTIMAYPNPVKDVLVVEVNGARTGKATITVSDITGKILRQQEVTSEKTEVNMSGYTSGIYFVKYADEAGSEMLKVNKQ